MRQPLRLLLFGAATLCCVVSHATASEAPANSARPIDIQLYSPDTKHDIPDIFSRMVSKSSDALGLSEFDDEYFARAALHVSIPLHAHDDATALMDAAKLMVDTAMPETAKGHAAARVALAQERVFVTLDSGLHSADHAEVQRHVLTAVHAFVQDCPEASSLRSGSLADKYMQRVARAADSSGFKAAWCTPHRRAAAADGSAPKPLLNFAYPTATHSFDHTGARALLEAQHPAASVHRRALSPPVLKSPLHLITLRTKPLYTLPDGSRRHRMLASASSESMGNISIGYDVLVRPEVLSLDDRAEVLEVNCTAAPVITVTSAHPLPIEANVTALEGDTHWGCNVDDSHEDNSFLVRVLDVADTLLESGLLQYTMRVKVLSPLAGAAVMETVMHVSPGKQQNDTALLSGPASNETAVAAKRRTSISCDNSIFGVVSYEGYAMFDCSATVYTWRWNMDSSGYVIQDKLFPLSSISNIWFEDTYFSFSATVHLELSSFAGPSGIGVPHLVAKVTLTGSAKVLVVATETTRTSSTWTALTSLLEVQDVLVYVGSLPVQVLVHVGLVSRKPTSTLSNLHAEVGAAYTLHDASLGVQYSNKLKPSGSSSCYCVSACGSLAGSVWCYMNEGCTSSVLGSGTSSGFKWAYCGSFVTQNSGWDTIASLSHSLRKIGPSVSSNGVTVRSGVAKYQLGAQMRLTLFDTVPLTLTPYFETELDFDPARRQLQGLEQSPGTALQRQASGACASSYSTGSAGLRIGRSGVDIGIDDVKIDFPVIGEYTILNAWSLLNIHLTNPHSTRYSMELCAPVPTPSPTQSKAPAPSVASDSCPVNAMKAEPDRSYIQTLEGSSPCYGWAIGDFGCSSGSVDLERHQSYCEFSCLGGTFRCRPNPLGELTGPWLGTTPPVPYPSRVPTPSASPIICPSNAVKLSSKPDLITVPDAAAVPCNGWARADFRCSSGLHGIVRVDGNCVFRCYYGRFVCSPREDSLPGPWYDTTAPSPYPSRKPSAAPSPSQTPQPPSPSPSPTSARTPQPTTSPRPVVGGASSRGDQGQGGGDGAAGGGGSAGSDASTAGGGASSAASSNQNQGQEDGSTGAIAGSTVAAVVAIAAALAAVWWFKFRGKNTPPSIKSKPSGDSSDAAAAQSEQPPAPQAMTPAPPQLVQPQQGYMPGGVAGVAGAPPPPYPQSAQQHHTVAYAPTAPGSSTGGDFMRNNPLVAARQAQSLSM